MPVSSRVAAFLAVLLFALLFAGAWLVRQSDETSGALRPLMSGTKIGGDFTLTDQSGGTVTNASWPGKFRLVYFGFTYCPAICPTELQKIAGVMKSLGADAAQIQPIFITVDPERDTPEILKSYVALFDDRLAGLTGTRAQIDAVLKSWHVYAAKVQDPGASDYTMDHSSFTYLTDPDGTLLALYKTADRIPDIAADIRSRISGR